jgi:ferric-dicitrate binding protein FerR (iron transport regulator)
MSDPLDLAAHLDALSPEERAALQDAASSDPSLARALDQWSALRRRVGDEVDAGMPSAEHLVLLAMFRSNPALLDDVDRERLPDAEARLQAGDGRAVAASALARLEADARAFDESWDRHMSESGVERRREMRRVASPILGAVDRPAVRRARVTPLWSTVGRLAAVFALISLGVLASYLWRRDAGLERIVAAEEMTIDLPDGSEVRLAAASELLIPEVAEADPDAGAHRDDVPRFARLVAGRALFRVARSTEPFLVETPAADITVLGTTLGVTASSGQTDVVLVSGVVDVASRGLAGTVRLEPGQSTAVRPGEAPAPASQADVDAALAWTGDLFIRSESLGTAAGRIASAFGVRVEVDSALATEAVTGSFDRDAGPRTALEALAMAVDGRLEETAGGFRIVPSTD